jgi:hypothetical protein
MADSPAPTVRPLSDRLREIPDHRAGSGTVALLLHALAIAFLIFLSQQPLPESGTGLLGPLGTGGGGGGGEVIHYISLPGDPAPPPPPQVVPPVIPEVEPDLVIPDPVPEPEVLVMVDSVPLSALEPPPLETGTGAGGGAPELGRGGGPGSGGGSGGGDGLGAGPGTGGGSGPGTGGGDGTLGSPPVPMMLLFPPSAPRDMRGKKVTVTLLVDAQGVVQQVLALEPETGNGDFDDDIRRTAMAWRFRPGRDPAGTPVAAVYPVELTF